MANLPELRSLERTDNSSTFGELIQSVFSASSTSNQSKILACLSALIEESATKATKGKHGTIAIAPSAWSDTTATMRITALGANDAIVLTPHSLEDRALLRACDPFISCEAGSITLTASEVPTQTITLDYFIWEGENDAYSDT